MESWNMYPCCMISIKKLCLWTSATTFVVTGSLTASDEGVCRRFMRSFFLAPQETGGYFVLNDVFIFISKRPSAVVNQVVNQENESNQNAGSVAETDPIPVEDHLISDHVAVENNVAGGEAMKIMLLLSHLCKVTKEEPKRPLLLLLPLLQLRRMLLRSKKSYASIVKVIKEGPPTPFVKPKTASKAVTKAVEGPGKSSVKPSQAAETTPTDRNVVENNTSHDEQGCSVFVKSLPFNATVQMVEEEFKKCDAIKPGGIQVRNNKASPFHTGEKELFVEEKRTTT